MCTLKLPECLNSRSHSLHSNILIVRLPRLIVLSESDDSFFSSLSSALDVFSNSFFSSFKSITDGISPSVTLSKIVCSLDSVFISNSSILVISNSCFTELSKISLNSLSAFSQAVLKSYALFKDDKQILQINEVSSS